VHGPGKTAATPAQREDGVVLTPGDSITLRAGEPRRAWNAGDDAAFVAVSYAAAQRRALPVAA
jgi:hypothetical protein